MNPSIITSTATTRLTVAVDYQSITHVEFRAALRAMAQTMTPETHDRAHLSLIRTTPAAFGYERTGDPTTPKGPYAGPFGAAMARRDAAKQARHALQCMAHVLPPEDTEKAREAFVACMPFSYGAEVVAELEAEERRDRERWEREFGL